MSDVESRITVPPLGDGIKSALVVKWNKGWRERVSKGELLVVLETVNGTIEIRSSVSGYLARQSAPVGREVRAGNKLGDVEPDAPPIYRVKVRRVQPLDLPECIRLDYLIGFSLRASEWVCQDAPGLVGEKGCGWWVDRIGSVPPDIDEAYAQAAVLPSPEQISTAYPQQNSTSDGLGPPVIRQIDYSAPTRTGRTSISGDNCVFLFEEDVRELEKCAAELELADSSYEIVSDRLPAPSWWPRIAPGEEEIVPISPPNRTTVSPHVAQAIRRVLMTSRNHWQAKSLPIGVAFPNLCMAYTISEPPTVQELRVFFPSMWPSKDIIISRHFDTLAAHLEKATSGSWICDVLDPLVGRISPGGKIKIDLWWCSGGYKFDEAWISCLDIRSVFGELYTGGSARSEQENDRTNVTSFRQALYELLRNCINLSRVDLGLPQIGEGWISETDLYYRVKRLFPDEEVVHHGRTAWLGRQHLDIWLPTRNVAIEYQGEQHFIEIGLFGGAEGLARTQERDEKKRTLCRANGVRLIEISFNDGLTDEWIKKQIA